jgi:hypothetical protein
VSDAGFFHGGPRPSSGRSRRPSRRRRVAELLQRLRGERRTHTTGAVDDHRRGLVGHPVLDLGLEVAARDVDRAGQRALLVLVGLAHVEDQRPAGDLGRGGRGVDFTDLGLGRSEEVTEGSHDRKPTDLVRIPTQVGSPTSDGRMSPI